MAELPIMPLKIDALVADTTHMTTEEFGAYCKILFAMWRHGARLKDDDGELAIIAGMSLPRWKKLAEKVRRPLTAADGVLSQKRMTDTWIDVQEKRQKNALNGTKGAGSKWGKKMPDEFIPLDLLNRRKRSQRLAAAREKGRHTAEEWEALKAACGDICVKCKSDDDVAPVKDHIIPIYQGGSDGIDNLQPLCRRCNAQKGPECIDYRPEDWPERLANAWRTPSAMPVVMPDNQTKINNTPSKTLEVSGSLEKIVRANGWAK